MRHQRVPCRRSACFNSRDPQDSVRDNVTRCTRVRDVLHPENEGTLSLNLNVRCVKSTCCVVVGSSVALQRYMVLVFRDRCTHDECASHRHTEDQEVSHMIEGGPGCGSSRRLIPTVDVLGIEGRDVRTAQQIRRKRNFFFATCLKRFCKHQLCTNTKRDTARGHFVLWLRQTWHRAVARESHGDFKTWGGCPDEGPTSWATLVSVEADGAQRCLRRASFLWRAHTQPFTPRSAHRLLLSKMDEGASRHLCAQRPPVKRVRDLKGGTVCASCSLCSAWRCSRRLATRSVSRTPAWAAPQ